MVSNDVFFNVHYVHKQMAIQAAKHYQCKFQLKVSHSFKSCMWGSFAESGGMLGRLGAVCLEDLPLTSVPELFLFFGAIRLGSRRSKPGTHGPSVERVDCQKYLTEPGSLIFLKKISFGVIPMPANFVPGNT